MSVLAGARAWHPTAGFGPGPATRQRHDAQLLHLPAPTLAVCNLVGRVRHQLSRWAEHKGHVLRCSGNPRSKGAPPRHFPWPLGERQTGGW